MKARSLMRSPTDVVLGHRWRPRWIPPERHHERCHSPPGRRGRASPTGAGGSERDPWAGW